MAPDGKRSTRQLTFDPTEDHPLSSLIISAVADEKGVDVTDLEPLVPAVDIEGIQAGIDVVQRNSEGSAQFSFSFEGYLVTVTSDGTVELSTSS